MLTIDEIDLIAEKVAEKLATKAVINDTPQLFTSKSALARYLKCDRKTIYSMIERDQVIITPNGFYSLNHKIK